MGRPVGLSGTVHSLFRAVAILAVPGQQLVTLASLTAGGLPGSISVDFPSDFDFKALLQLGSRAAVRGGLLRFGQGDVAVDLRNAQPWRSRIAELALDLNRAEPRRAWEAAAAALSADRRSDALATIARHPIRALIEAASAFDAKAARRAMLGLVGLGSGGTPAGDDLLVGFLSGLRATKSLISPMRVAFPETLGKELQPLLLRTNDVSRVYLAAAAVGEVSERLTSLAAAIGRGDSSSTVDKVAKAAIAVGHTSGADGTLGLLLGTAAWGPKATARRVISLIDGSSLRVEA